MVSLLLWLLNMIGILTLLLLVLGLTIGGVVLAGQIKAQRDTHDHEQ